MLVYSQLKNVQILSKLLFQSGNLHEINDQE